MYACLQVCTYVGVGGCLLVSRGRPYSCRHFYKPDVIGSNGGRNRVDHYKAHAVKGGWVWVWVWVGMGVGVMVVGPHSLASGNSDNGDRLIAFASSHDHHQHHVPLQENSPSIMVST